MEHSRLSWRSISLAALLHVLLLFLLFYVTQEEIPFFTPRQEQEPAVVFLPSQPPPLQSMPVNQPTLAQSITPPTTQNQSAPEETPEKTQGDPALSAVQTKPSSAWSSERARQAWRKKTPPTPAASPTKKAATSYQEDLMHDIIDGIPFEEKSAPLKQRIEAQLAKDGQEHFQSTTMKAICYELNKQKIMEASINIPHKIVFKVTLERNGTLLNVELIEPSYSDSFNAACIYAIQRAAPFRTVPQSIPGDPAILTFTFYYQSTERDSKIPTPVMFYIN